MFEPTHYASAAGVPPIVGAGNNAQSSTSAELISTQNRNEPMNGIACSAPPSTSAEAQKLLAQRAIQHFLPNVNEGMVAVIAGNQSDDGTYQVQLAINLFLMSGGPGISENAAFNSAVSKLKAALEKNVSNNEGAAPGVAGLCRNWSPETKKLHSKGVEINGLISQALKECPGAEPFSMDKVTGEYLSNGYPEAFVRNHCSPGARLTGASSNKIAGRGNGSQSATQILDNLLRKELPNATQSDRLAGNVLSMLHSLDLDRREHHSSPRASRKGQGASVPPATDNRAVDKARLSKGPLNMGNRTDVKVENNNSGMAEVFLQAFKLGEQFGRVSGENSALREENLSLKNQLIASRGLVSAGAPRHDRSEVDVVTAESVLSGAGSEVNAEDASVQEAANVVRTGIQQLGQPSRISSLDSDERDSDSGIEDEDQAPPPPPPLPSSLSSEYPQISQEIRNNYPSLMGALREQAALPNRGLKSVIERPLPQPRTAQLGELIQRLGQPNFGLRPTDTSERAVVSGNNVHDARRDSISSSSDSDASQIFARPVLREADEAEDVLHRRRGSVASGVSVASSVGFPFGDYSVHPAPFSSQPPLWMDIESPRASNGSSGGNSSQQSNTAADETGIGRAPPAPSNADVPVNNAPNITSSELHLDDGQVGTGVGRIQADEAPASENVDPVKALYSLMSGQVRQPAKTFPKVKINKFEPSLTSGARSVLTR